VVTETNIFSVSIKIANKVNNQIRKVDPFMRNSQSLSSSKPSLSFTTEDCSDIPSQQPDTELYVPVSCLQQSGTDRYPEAETCSPQFQHKKECSENMLMKEDLMMNKQLQAV